MPSLSMRANHEKKTVNTTINDIGCNTAHATPSAVCLYRTLISRSVSNQSNSLCRHNSRA